MTELSLVLLLRTVAGCDLSPDGPLARPRSPDDEGVGLVPAGEVPGEGDGHHGLGSGVGQQTGQQALGKHDFWKHWT